jgi:Tol biopolymer transport system component
MNEQHPRASWCFGFLVFAGVAAAQSTERISVDSAGMPSNGVSGHPSISADGRFVAFESQATNLVAGDTNAVKDVFVHDRVTGTTERVSVDSNGAQANGLSARPSITPDGRFVAFESEATNLVAGDMNSYQDIFIHDRVTGETSRVSVAFDGGDPDSASVRATLSADGRYVAFESQAMNLVPNDTFDQSDVFVRDRLNGSTERVSVDSSGAQAFHDSWSASISADGRYVAFESAADNLVPNDTNHTNDVFVHDRATGQTTRVSLNDAGAEANSESGAPAISADGRWVAFYSYASNLAPNGGLGANVFVRDLITAHTTRISQTPAGMPANGLSFGAFISADGRFVGFYSTASNMVSGDTNAASDTFVHDRFTGGMRIVSVDSSGGLGNDGSYGGSMSADGRWVAFESVATNLVPGDTNAANDIFVRDRGPQPFLIACFGDGSGGACPCANTGVAGHGCNNSVGTGGASLSGSGNASLSADTLVLTSSSELASASSVVLQGTDLIAPVAFGDGLRCAGGSLKRLYVHNAVGGVVAVPQGADLPISVRSASLGDAIPPGATRHYQVYYRDPNLGFCAAPSGNTWNASESLSALWSN